MADIQRKTDRIVRSNVSFHNLRDVLQRIADHPINRIHELTPIAWKQAQQRTPSIPEAATV